MNSKKSVKVKTSAKAAAKKTVNKKPATAKNAKAKNFLFSIPSQHTSDDTYEHLVIAPTKEEACRLLAEHRVTEKRPEMEGATRAQLVKHVWEGYCNRDVLQVEPRKEAAGVIAVNHHKMGAASPAIN
jgi:hypothetical protein